MSFIKKAYLEVRSFAGELEQNSVGAYSAQAAFFIITSFFPFMLLLVSLLHFTPLDESIITTNIAGGLFGNYTGNFLNGIIREITLRATPGTLLGAAGLSAIWAASRCLLAIIKGLNRVYSAESKRGFLKLQLISVVYVFVFQLILVISLSLLVFGEQIDRTLMLNQSLINLRWVIGILLLILFFTFVYKAIPERKTNLLSEMPGAILSAAGWLGFSGLFAIYIDNFSNFGAVYGSLTAAVIMMLWLYFCMYILFVGAQFNMWLQNKEQSKREPPVNN
ncbi:MAG: YihY/virulence factor BrkB family protein [Oscillospiraceae bacterium]|nr:YihY/virulence factor BrkB family protein [Oscillospiraceae bacterium]